MAEQRGTFAPRPGYVVCWLQTPAVRLAASEVCGKRRREPAERDRRLEKLAIEVLTALGERDATTEQRAGAALQAMITDESLTVSEAVQRCAGAKSATAKLPGFAS
jgi:hypothetical protein